MKKCNPVTPSEIVAFYRKTRSIKSTARLLHISERTAKKVLVDAGIVPERMRASPTRSRDWDAIIPAIVALHDKGFSQAKIAATLHYSKNTVRKALMRAGRIGKIKCHDKEEKRCKTCNIILRFSGDELHPNDDPKETDECWACKERAKRIMRLGRKGEKNDNRI